MKPVNTFLPSLGKENKLSVQLCLRVLLKTLLISEKILKADLDDITCLKGFTLLQYVDDLLLCFSSQVSSQEDIYLFEHLVLRGHQVSKGNLVYQTRVQYLGHLI